MTPDPNLLRVEEAATYLEIQPQQVRRLMVKGVLVEVVQNTPKRGRPRYVDVQSVYAYAESRKSDLERAWETHWARHGNGELYAREYVFDAERRWRFDVAFPAQHVAVELHGGNWTQGRHVRPQGYQDDRAKMNAALLAGWRVLELTTDMLADDPERCCAQVVALLERTGR